MSTLPAPLGLRHSQANRLDTCQHYTGLPRLCWEQGKGLPLAPVASWLGGSCHPLQASVRASMWWGMGGDVTKEETSLYEVGPGDSDDLLGLPRSSWKLPS